MALAPRLLSWASYLLLTRPKEAPANTLTSSQVSDPAYLGSVPTFSCAVHGSHVRAEVQDAGSDWHGDIHRSASHPHGLYLLVALAAACGCDGTGRSRTVWFRLDERDGQVPAELGRP